MRRKSFGGDRRGHVVYLSSSADRSHEEIERRLIRFNFGKPIMVQDDKLVQPGGDEKTRSSAEAARKAGQG